MSVCANLLLTLVLLGMDAVSAEPTSGPLQQIDTPIHTIYVVTHAHLDISYVDVPSDVAAKYKRMIDEQIDFAAAHPDYKFSIEETWSLEQWLRRTPDRARVNQFIALAKAGRVAVAGGHSTMHSGKLSAEELPRLLFNAAKYRNEFGITIDTVFHDDVPGVAWTYPQILAKSGIKYLICGENLFIGGGFTQPWPSFPFYWKAPDGTRLLTWSTRKSYIEAHEFKEGYGLPFWKAGDIKKDRLTSSLLELKQSGYPYDALMIQYSFDDAFGGAHYDAIHKWNAQYSNPKFVLAIPSDFFGYLEKKYGREIQERSGNWTTIWDSSQMLEAQGEKVVKNAHDMLPAAEKMCSIGAALGLTSYPHDKFNEAWDTILALDEHSGAGADWDARWTQAQVDQQNREFRDFTLRVADLTTETLSNGAQSLLGSVAAPRDSSVVVFNPLSWKRTDLARVRMPEQLLAGGFSIVDEVTREPVTHEIDQRTSEVVFVARDVPPVGYRRFLLREGTAANSARGISATGKRLENRFYRIRLDGAGHVASIYDKTARRELVKPGTPTRFNQMVTATNLQYFRGESVNITDSTHTEIRGSVGPVSGSLLVTNADHPLAATEIRLYNDLDRIDIINTPDRSQMAHAGLADNSKYCASVFPFNLHASTRIDTAAGWLDPARDSLAGSYIGSYEIQHCIDASERGYGVTFASPDVFSHSIGSLQATDYAPSTSFTIFSRFIRYIDESNLKGHKLGVTDTEPGAPARWNLLYSIRPHRRGFDAIADARFGAEICTPFVARFVEPARHASSPPAALSYFSVNYPNVAITGVKQADFGKGMIVRLEEMAGEQAAAVRMRSDAFQFDSAVVTTPLEADTPAKLPITWNGSIALSMKPHEVKTLRVFLKARR